MIKLPPNSLSQGNYSKLDTNLPDRGQNDSTFFITNAM